MKLFSNIASGERVSRKVRAGAEAGDDPVANFRKDVESNSKVVLGSLKKSLPLLTNVEDEITYIRKVAPADALNAVSTSFMKDLDEMYNAISDSVMDINYILNTYVKMIKNLK